MALKQPAALRKGITRDLDGRGMIHGMPGARPPAPASKSRRPGRRAPIQRSLVGGR